MRETPGPGQESVWDYPRPPRLEAVSSHIVVELGGLAVAVATSAYRVLETSHPPTYYLPPAAFAPGTLEPVEGGSFCEWKGQARYWTLVGGGRREEAAAWSYPDPSPAFSALRDHVAVYCGRTDRCTVDGEVALPQPGGFYGGWVTSKVAGPFKGVAGSWGW